MERHIFRIVSFPVNLFPHFMEFPINAKKMLRCFADSSLAQNDVQWNDHLFLHGLLGKSQPAINVIELFSVAI